MIIDVSSYLGMWPYWDNNYFDETGEKLLKLMDRNNVEKAIIIALKSILYDDVEGNDLVFDVVNKYPERLIASVTINPKMHDDPGEYLAECLEKKAVAIKLYPYYHGYNLNSDDKDLRKIVEQATNSGCPVVIPVRLLMNWGFYSVPIADIVSFISDFPNTKFLVDNFNYGEYPPLLNFAKANKNVYLGTTSLTMMKGIESLVSEVGRDRLLCGTGAPLQNPACGLIKIEKAGLEGQVKDAVFCENAKKLFGI